MRFRPEPAPRSDGAAPPRAAVLLVNLGTPDAPTADALRRYLAQFLSDPRVVEIPAWIWKPILHGVILRVRPARSAAKYATVWMPEGSPLGVWTSRQAQLLAVELSMRGEAVRVSYAMRYGSPSIAGELDALRALGIERVLILPLYPQYAAATTASAIDDVGRWASAARHVPELRFVNRYHDDDAYLDALAASVQDHWAREGRSTMLVMSFHGIPERSGQLGDPYAAQCRATAALLAERLGLDALTHRVTFQSRFGRAAWLQPYTEPTLVSLAQDGTKRVDVMCPGFPADCLETLEEIAQEARDAFLAAGGEVFHYIACLNDRPDGIAALAGIAQRHMGGWSTRDAALPA